MMVKVIQYELSWYFLGFSGTVPNIYINIIKLKTKQKDV